MNIKKKLMLVISITLGLILVSCGVFFMMYNNDSFKYNTDEFGFNKKERTYKSNELFCEKEALVENAILEEVLYVFDDSKTAIDGKSLHHIKFDKVEDYEYYKKSFVPMMEKLGYQTVADDKNRITTDILNWDKIQEKKSERNIYDYDYMPYINYYDLMNYYYSLGYTCNGEADDSRGNLLDIISKNSEGIIYNDKVYSIVYYKGKENGLSVVNIDGREKKTLITANISAIHFILNDYLYYTVYDSNEQNSYEYFRISINDYNDIKSLGAEMNIPKEELAQINDDRGRVIVRHKIPSNQEAYTPFPQIYNNKLLTVYLWREVHIANKAVNESWDKEPGKDTLFYDGSSKSQYRIMGISVHDEYLYLLISDDSWESNIDNKLKIEKVDIKTKKVVNTTTTGIKRPEDYKFAYDFNDNGMIFLADETVYKYDYKTMIVNEVNKINLDRNKASNYTLIYYKNKIIYDIEDNVSGYINVIIYDELTEEKKEYKDMIHFQVAADNLYLIDHSGKIIKETLK